MKKKVKNIVKIIIFIILLLLLMIGVSSGVYIFLKENNKRDNVSENMYVGVLEDGTYYIAKAKKNIRFQINDSDTNKYKLTDQNNNVVESQVIQKDNKNLIQANKLYNEGETYTLELIDTSFSEEQLKDTKKVIFKIEESEKANYKLNENVKIIEDSNQIQIEENQDEKTIKLPNEIFNNNDIILVKDQENPNRYKGAYKIENIENDIATVSEPEVAEIFDEFDLYHEEKVNFENIKIDKDFEDKIELAVKKTPLYKFLVSEVYAADGINVKPKVTANKDQIKIEILITVKANGEEFLGIKALTTHDLELKYVITLGCDVIVDMQKGVGINLDMALKQGFEFEINLKSNSTIIEGVGELTDDQYIKSIKEIVDKLEGATSDTSKGKMPIGAIEVPTTMTGVNAYIDIYMQTELALKINATCKQKIETIEHLGIIMNKDSISPYFSADISKADTEISAYGKANMRFGIGFDIGVSIISKDLAHVGIGEEGGIYGDIFASMNATYDAKNPKLSENFVGKIEAGIYFRTKFSAGINVFFIKKDFSKDLAEFKKPFIKLEKKWEVSTNETIETSANSSNSTGNTNKPNKNTGSSNSSNKNVTSSISSNKDVVARYKEYVVNKRYLSKAGETWEDSTKKYSIYDINQDGIVELLIMSNMKYDEAWKTTIICTYDIYKDQVVFVDCIYTYGEIRYSKENKEIIYTGIKPYKDVGVYGFYKLSGNKFKLTKSVGWSEEGKYFVDIVGTGSKPSTAENNEKYFKNLAYFKFAGMEMFN